MNTLVIVAGPTAVGKTAWSIQLAQALQTEIISCDSRQCYRELRIGVARPEEEELRTVAHHLVAHRTIKQPYNAYLFEQEALQVAERLFATHPTVIATGGTGLYIDALRRGMALMPDPSPRLRQYLTHRLQTEGIRPLQTLLSQVDPEAYSRVDTLNPSRLQRALETTLTTGKPLSHSVNAAPRPRPFRIVTVVLDCDKQVLRQRIDQRVDRMMTLGLLDEVRQLLPYRQLNALNTVGYKELFAHLDGLCTLEQAVQQIKVDTWHYAKKQLTWISRYEDALHLPNTAPVDSLLQALSI